MDKGPLLSAGRMAVIFDVPERTLQRILAQEGVENTRGQGYDFNVSVKKVITHYRVRAEALDTAVAADRARKAKSEANIAELQEAKMIGSLASVDECRRLFEFAIVQTREGVRKLKGFDESQKRTVCELLASVKFAAPPQESDPG